MKSGCPIRRIHLGCYNVAESGAVAGLSASGITSGLAALGGGSVASGGLGMVGGLAAVASGAAVMAFAVSGTVWLFSHMVSQDRLEEQKSKMLQMAAEFNFQSHLEQ